MTPTNQFPRDYDGIQRQNVDAAADTLNLWVQRALKAEAACGEMRRLIVLLECKCDTASLGGYICPRCHALSLDAGKGFLSPERFQQLQSNVAETIQCAACAEHIFCGSSSQSHTCVSPEKDREIERLRAVCKRAAELYDHLAMSPIEAASKFGPYYEPPSDEEWLEMRKMLAEALNTKPTSEPKA